MFLWLKALHVIAVIVWMAGLFYLPRLFVYHTSQAIGSDSDLLFKIMERRLMKAIMRPAACVALLAGVATFITGHFQFQAWLLLKLLGVAGLIAYHGLLEIYLGKFAHGERHRSAVFFRLLNEVPTLLLIWIVICVVVKPFS